MITSHGGKLMRYPTPGKTDLNVQSIGVFDRKGENKSYIPALLGESVSSEETRIITCVASLSRRAFVVMRWPALGILHILIVPSGAHKCP